MSWLSKTFRRVAEDVGSIGPAVLAAGAIVFTAGSALGVTGSWGDAVKSLVTQLGAESTLANTLTGALTSAGYGAVIGGATAVATGGKFKNGLLAGAATGGLIGGVAGAFAVPMPGTKLPTDDAMNANQLETSAEPVHKVLPSEIGDNGLLGGRAPFRVTGETVGGGLDQVQGGGMADNLGVDPGPQVGSAGPDLEPWESRTAWGEYTPRSDGNGLLGAAQGSYRAAQEVGMTGTETASNKANNGFWAWAEKNPAVVGTAAGGIVSGIGSGVSGMAQAAGAKEAARTKAEADRETMEANRAAIAGNYRTGTGNGLLRSGAPARTYGAGRPTPDQRWDPRIYGGSWQVVNSRIVFVPNQMAGA